jgi:hypothetical protein
VILLSGSRDASSSTHCTGSVRVLRNMIVVSSFGVSGDVPVWTIRTSSSTIFLVGAPFALNCGVAGVPSGNSTGPGASSCFFSAACSCSFHVFPAVPGALALLLPALTFRQVSSLCPATSDFVSEIPWLASASPAPALASPLNQDHSVGCGGAKRRGEKKTDGDDTTWPMF